jgi:hypothetical protein
MEIKKRPAREVTSNTKPDLRRKNSASNPSSPSSSRLRGGSNAVLKALREMKFIIIGGLS